MSISIKKLLERSDERIESYDNILSEAEKTFRELNSNNMQATLIQIEDFLDSNNIYAFDNWFEGIVWDGPNISRYWIDITLKYPYNLMPQPKAVERLIDMGVITTFKKSTEFEAIKVKKTSDLDPVTRKPKEEEKDIWLIKLKIPRRLIEDPMPNDTEEFDNLQNKEATAKAEAEESVDVEEELAGGGEDFGGVEEGGGDELEL